MTGAEPVIDPALSIAAWTTGEVLTFAHLRLDLAGRTLASASGESISLTPAEFRLLGAFLRHAGRVLTRNQLLDLVSDRRADPFDRSIDVLISRLRRKIERNPAAPEMIVTSPGFGYKFTVKPVSVTDETVPATESALAGLPRAPPVSESLNESSVLDGAQEHAHRRLDCETRGPGWGHFEFGAPRVLLGKPSLAVLPFANLGSIPEQEWFCDELVDDILTELSRNSSLFVIAHNSSFAYRNQSRDVRQVARELGVGYVLKGSARHAAGRVRVNAQLIECEYGRHIWAGRYDELLQNILAAQDEITASVVTAIVSAVDGAELRCILRMPAENLGAWETYQRGLWHLAHFNPVDHEQAQEYFQRATVLDPTFAPALAALGQTYLGDLLQYGSRPISVSASLAGKLARRALAIDPRDAAALQLLTDTMMVEGKVEEASFQASQTFGANSNYLGAVTGRAWILLSRGDTSTARNELMAYQLLNPRNPFGALALGMITSSLYLERDYAKAAAAALRAMSRYDELPSLRRLYAASLGQLGSTVEAREALQIAIEVGPQAFRWFTSGCPPWIRPGDYDHVLDGLHKAGWQG
jgi:TolB-like protein/DNA-binding winged helix-turn-helix (wHTH) protein/Flp pilus assembly protein TadD